MFVGANRTMSIYVPVKTLTTNELGDALENMMCVRLKAGTHDVTSLCNKSQGLVALCELHTFATKSSRRD